MGVNPAVVTGLAELSTRFQPAGRSLMLGRQSFKLDRWPRKRGFKRAGQSGLARYRADLSLECLAQDDGYAETLFEKLGLGHVETLDYSDFEGAELVWDLNAPVPEDWAGEFGLIFDGGTIEHVFNVPQALSNMFTMLATNGRFVGVNPLNGWVGHGLYQFTAELVWAFWDRMCGCTIHKCVAVDVHGQVHYDYVANAVEGKRHKLQVSAFARDALPARPLLLYYEIEKTPEAKMTGAALQGDYVRRWSAASAPQPVGEPA